MSSNQQNNKRVAKNTFFLYFRFFFTTVIGLYTSRLLLSTLGISDYGVYNIVGGIVTMTSFFQSGLAGATQRFFSFELGRGDIGKLKLVFSTSMIILIFFAAVILIVAETVGVWFVNIHLNIAADRLVAANWTYQFSILAFLTSIMVVPYNSCIIAHEQMKAFAYISILEVVLKLGIVLCLLVSPIDRLILYSFLMVAVQTLVRSCVRMYCKHHFEECRFKWILDREVLKSMFSFSGWTIIGNIGFISRDQGGNILLNLFYGTTVNAARGVALQVSNMVTTFAQNFFMAMNPQITKLYASGDYGECKKYVFSGGKLTFSLLAIVSVPLMMNIDYVLKLWLSEVPPFTGAFVSLSLVSTLFYVMSQSVTVAIQATGKLKVFQIGICCLLVLEIPAVWMLLAMGLPPYASFIPVIVNNVVFIFFRYYLLHKYVPSFLWGEYVVQVLTRCFSVLVLSLVLGYVTKAFFAATFVGFLSNAFVIALEVSVLSYYVGFNSREKGFVNRMLTVIINKIKNKLLRIMEKEQKMG